MKIFSMTSEEVNTSEFTYIIIFRFILLTSFLLVLSIWFGKLIEQDSRNGSFPLT